VISGLRLVSAVLVWFASSNFHISIMQLPSTTVCCRICCLPCRQTWGKFNS
jgi:hypothetical protein